MRRNAGVTSLGHAHGRKSGAPFAVCRVSTPVILLNGGRRYAFPPCLPSFPTSHSSISAVLATLMKMIREDVLHGGIVTPVKD